MEDSWKEATEEKAKWESQGKAEASQKNTQFLHSSGILSKKALGDWLLEMI